MKLRYIGPHDSVLIPTPSGRDLIVAHGDEFEVDNETFGASLLGQPSNFKSVEKPKPAPAGEKPASAGGKG